MLHAVQYDRADGHLAYVGLAAGLGGYEPGQELQLARAVAVGVVQAPGGEPQRGERGGAGPAVDFKAVGRLEAPHGGLGIRAVHPVDRAGPVAPVGEARLDFAHGEAHVAPVVGLGVRRLRKGYDRDVDGEEHGQGQYEFASPYNTNRPLAARIRGGGALYSRLILPSGGGDGEVRAVVHGDGEALEGGDALAAARRVAHGGKGAAHAEAAAEVYGGGVGGGDVERAVAGDGDVGIVAPDGARALAGEGDGAGSDDGLPSSRYGIECFGNVLINKKETYIYGDRADYNGEINEARVYAPLVMVVDGDATLYTYDFRFNTLDNIGTFSGGGMLTNRENHLESDRGYYYADTHQIICVDRVEMRNDKYELKGDSVVYDTDTDQAHFFERTNIWNEGGDYIYADRGRYEKPRELYVLTRNGYVMTEKQELWSDSLDYYRESGHALLFRNIQIDDAEHKVLAFGDYGEYWKEPGNALLTQRPSVVSYDTSQSDSLYMCADSMFLYTISKSEQARADSLAKVKAKAADSLAGSKGGSSVDSLAAKPSAADPKASQDGSQADAAAPQAAAGAVETSSETADAGSGSAAELKKEERGAILWMPPQQ